MVYYLERLKWKRIVCTGRSKLSIMNKCKPFVSCSIRCILGFERRLTAVAACGVAMLDVVRCRYGTEIVAHFAGPKLYTGYHIKHPL